MPSVEPLFLSEVEMRDICPFHETLAAIRYLVDQTVYKVYRGTFIFVVNRYHGHLHSVYTLRYDLIRGWRTATCSSCDSDRGRWRQATAYTNSVLYSHDRIADLIDIVALAPQ